MSFSLHLRGGPMDGQIVAVHDAPPVFNVLAPPDFRDVFGAVPLRYNRRPPRLLPARFKADHPADHWLYDWSQAPPIERAVAQVVLPSVEELAVLRWISAPWAISYLAEAVMAKLEALGSYDRRDLEWEVCPFEAAGDAFPYQLLRATVVMEVS